MNKQNIKNQSVYEALREYADNSFFIISPTSREKLSEEAKQVIDDGYVDFIMTHELSYDQSLPDVSGYDNVVGLGGGTAIDYAKYLAKLNSMWCIAIPSMLSTNVFATNKVAVASAKGKHTVEGVLPNVVIVDQEYLDKSKTENLYGLVDVFSIFNALRDWDLGIQNGQLAIDKKIYQRAEELLLSSRMTADRFVHGGVDNLGLFSVIKEAGYITNDYGSGRPESGSEHIFASALETDYMVNTGNIIPHALAVALGIHIMTYFFTCDKRYMLYDHEDMVKFDKLDFKGLGVINKINEFGFTYDYIWGLLKGLQPRLDKYTLVDELHVDDSDYEPVKKWLEDCGFVFA